ncbi:MAG: PilT protein [Hyphomicrobiales bacterium]|nr:PilT protein [Hyphomicrobiales bacterium]
MIAVDASAILAIIRVEDEAERFSRLLSDYDWMIGAPSVLECRMVVHRSGDDADRRTLDFILAYRASQIVDFGTSHLAAAELAFERFGRGRHPAKLNFGDCMSYAIARVADVPLLYKGNDFVLTDILPVTLPLP